MGINEKDILKLFSLVVLKDCTVCINNSSIWRKNMLEFGGEYSFLRV